MVMGLTALTRLGIQSTVEFWFDSESLEYSIWKDLELETDIAIKLLSSWTCEILLDQCS